MSNTISPKIKTLVTDLKSLSIGEYLKTTEFERNCIQMGIEGLWHQANESTKNNRHWFSADFDHQSFDTEDAMHLILDRYYLRDKESFTIFLFRTLKGFIEWSDKSIEFKSVFEDLKLIGFPDEELVSLKGILENKQLEWLTNEKETKENEQVKEIPISNYPPEKLKANKKKWINLISTSKLEDAIGEIFDFSEEINDYHTLKDIVIQSSRMSDLNKQFNQNILNDENYRIERNKITSALIDIIQKLK